MDSTGAPWTSSTAAPSSGKGKGKQKATGKGTHKGNGKGKGKRQGKNKSNWDDLIDPAVVRIKNAYPVGSEERRFLLEELALQAWGVPRCAG